MKQRLLALFLALALIVSAAPVTVRANETDLGSVRVYVENNTCPNDSGNWQSGAEYWDGVLVDQTVELSESSNMLTCIETALARSSVEASISSGYISAIGGLAEGDYTQGSYGGWMVTLNDWFTSEGISAYTVANGTLQDGDEIRVLYTMDYGADQGSSWTSNDKSLQALEFSTGTLTPAFSAGTKNYELRITEEITGIQVTPTAANKNFQVRIYKGEFYSPADGGYKRSAEIPVRVGDTLKIVVGNPSWPSMNNGEYGSGAENVPAEVYTVTVADAAARPSFASFFTALDGIAAVENDVDASFAVVGTRLASTNKDNSSASYITLTFSCAASLSFDFAASSEAKYDYMDVLKNGTSLTSGSKADYSGTASGTYTVQVQAGDIVKIGYRKDVSGDSNEDCIYLSSFRAVLPHQVVFHACNGTEETATQNVFGAANLDANTFSYDGYRFAGWATEAGGEVVYTDGASIAPEADINLYAVWTKVWNVTFPNMPERASLTVRQGETVIQPEEDGGYVLADGTYTYSASAFGYLAAENIPFTIDGADLAVAEGLTATARASVTFAVTPAEAEIVVRNCENTVMIAGEDGSYTLPVGEYAYTVRASGYLKQEGVITVADETPQTILLTLELSNVWEGNTAEPQAIEGIYRISNGAELAWFAAQVNAGETGLSAVLTDDLVLSSEDVRNVWTPIGSSAANAFTGSLDGAGHTVSGLYINAGEVIGLFGYIGSNGTVSNLIIDGADVKSTATGYSGEYYAGLIAGSNAGTISGVFLTNSTLSGGFIVGGIAGKNTGRVEACGNESAIVEQNAAKDQGVGGVVGSNGGTVCLSYNKAQIKNGHGKSNYGHFGGVAGNNSGTVENCYNLGAVDAAYYIGGICGKNTGSVACGYNAGTMGKSKSAIVGSNASGATIESCFYLDTCGAADDNALSKTDAELRLLSDALGGAFVNQKSGYPILKWQEPGATYVLTLTVSPAEATAAVTMDGVAVEAASAENGVYTYTNLLPGDYTYSVSCEAGDYAPRNGTVTIGHSDVSRTVALEPNRYAVNISVWPADAAVIVKNAANEVQTGDFADGTATYSLPNGEYTYTVEKFGYAPTAGSFTVNGTAVSERVTLTALASYTLTFVLTPADAAVTVSHVTAGVQNMTAPGVYSLCAATYQYTVRCQGYKTVSGEITISDHDETVTVIMEEIQPWSGGRADAFSGGDGSAESPYEIASGDELACLSYQVMMDSENYGNKYYVLTADIDMGGANAFMPIGDTSDKFSGTFDGAGHVISNLKINYDDNYAGLFGYVNGTVKNLTLKNADITGQDRTGAIAGYSDAAIQNCAVLDSSVTGTQYVGGMLGYVSASRGVTSCYTVGVRVTSGSSYAGGLSGYLSSGKLENCFARGEVSARTYAGGLSGYLYGYSNVANCYADADVSGNSSGLVAGQDKHSSDSSLRNTYYNSDRAGNAVGAGSSFYTAKSAAEMRTAEFAALLGSAYGWQNDDSACVNDGFPYLTGAYYEVLIPVQLAAPSNPVWNGTAAQWDAVESALAYHVTLRTADATLVAALTVGTASAELGEYIALNGSGSYYFTVQALGNGKEIRDSAEAVSPVYEATVRGAEVTFSITAENGEFAENEPVITVVTEGGAQIPFANNTAKFLPDGVYTYTVTAKTFATLEGTFTVAETAQTIPGVMIFSAVWDGQTTVEPPLENGVYQISNAYELAWFRDKVNTDLSAGSGSMACHAILTDNIDLGGHAWMPISPVTSTSAKKGYTGVFDGNGKTVSGLNAVGVEVTEYGQTKTQGAGLFGYVYTGGTVKNLTVAGSFTAVQFSGGIVAILAGGTVENCVNRADITAQNGGRMVGGVVGYMTNYSDNSSLVTGCGNTGVISGGSNDSIGGIVGSASSGSRIEKCYNAGSISGTESVGGIAGTSSLPIQSSLNTGSVTGSGRVGGITGFTNKTVADCYNTGAVSGTGKKDYGVGGIAGHLHSTYGGSVSGSYTAGAVTGNDGFTGGIVGTKGVAAEDTASITRSFFLASACAQGVGDGNQGEADCAESRTDAEMRRMFFAAELGGGFATRNDGGYPVLSWQEHSAPVTAFAPVPSDAQITVTQDGTVLAPTDEAGVYLLENGDYTYEVSKAHYETASGQFTVAGESRMISVTLNEETFPVIFAVTPADARIVVLRDGKVMEPDAEGYRLPDGEYTYTVSKFGYETADGSFTVAGAPLTLPEIVLTEAETYSVTLEPTMAEAADYSVTVFCGGENVWSFSAADAHTAALPAGEYTYRFTSEVYFGTEGTFVLPADAGEIRFPVELRTTWDGTSKTEPLQIGDVYQIGNAAELAWFADAVTGGRTALNAVLTADIYVNDELTQNVWMPIGSYSNQFAGAFDGNGKSVYGLSASLFGYNGADSMVKNLNVYGSNSGTSNVGGLCNASYGSIEGCVSHMDVTATGTCVGGMVGTLYESGHITDCANFGTVTGSYAGSEYSDSGKVCLGGIVGYARGAVTGCVNGGAVTASGANYGGVGGIVGATEAAVTDCYNTGSVTGSKRTGGIVGIANTSGSALENCYNVGDIRCNSTYSNPFGGAIAGSVADSSGVNIGTVTNCYYLENSYYYRSGDTIRNEGIGYGPSASGAEVRSAEAMKLDAFVFLLGENYRVDHDGINGGYPVLFWQGGRLPATDEDKAAVAADKAALNITPTEFREPAQITLPVLGENGSSICWQSDLPEIVSGVGVVTLPADGVATVTLTAVIAKGGAQDRKQFVLTVYSLSATAVEAVEAKINAISEVTLDSKDSIEAARAAYAALTPAQQALVSNLNILTAAEKAYSALENAPLPFTDVAETAWYASAVRFACRNGLMIGVSATEFEPEGKLTRAMLATILYRMEGAPKATRANTFSDVESGKWYTDAIAWASGEQIVFGVGGGKFEPDAPVTREQMATMLLRYAKIKQYDTSKTVELNTFSDASSVSGWAEDAMRWAVGSKLLFGRGNASLAPADTATRAEVSAILMRFLENVAN